ncbi:MAG: glycoside hydrolase family 97 protein [Ignavibacteriaceae bacterium]|nr:glycoside hydrolase family 97 protein [Ignavibacteriaceae bacterium]
MNCLVRILLPFMLISSNLYSQNNLSLSSPSGNFAFSFILQDGVPSYQLSFKNLPVIEDSKLGLVAGSVDFSRNLTLKNFETSSFNETWEPVWGEVKEILNNYNELRVTLQTNDSKPKHFSVVFRLFDDGLGFRYEFPQQEHLSYFTVLNEITQFTLTANHIAFWIPGDFDSNEYIYTKSRIDEINTNSGHEYNEISLKTIPDSDVVQTPLMLKSDTGLYINIHEAALVNFPVMQLNVDKQNFVLSSLLVPDAVGVKAHLQTPCKSPWRTILVSDDARDILASKTILNLNDPSKIEDPSWIKPQKYIGIWWELHIGKSSWNYADISNIKLENIDYDTVKSNGRHGATTERTKYYIDFASEHGFDGVLIEGWNTGWEDWYGNWKEEVFDFVTPYPDFDLEYLADYAASKNVKLIMHHETSGSVTNYERRLEAAFNLMKKFGYETVKTGYVGRIIPRGEHHDGQWMTDHFIRVVEKAAQYKIMVNSHESSRPTGLHRTYPNWLSSEAARGNEFNAWSKGNPPSHETILPFTRLMGGPMDYTPGIFKLKLNQYKKDENFSVKTTLCKQLALYVTMYSPLQMAADLPENYLLFPDAFNFIKDVAVDWDDTKILFAEPGEYLAIARKAKNLDDWFVGAITAEKEKSLIIDLDFLTPGINYEATIYTDKKHASYLGTADAYGITKRVVTSTDNISFRMVPGGGAAISLKPVK